MIDESNSQRAMVCNFIRTVLELLTRGGDLKQMEQELLEAGWSLETFSNMIDLAKGCYRAAEEHDEGMPSEIYLKPLVEAGLDTEFATELVAIAKQVRDDAVAAMIEQDNNPDDGKLLASILELVGLILNGLKAGVPKSDIMARIIKMDSLDLQTVEEIYYFTLDANKLAQNIRQGEMTLEQLRQNQDLDDPYLYHAVEYILNRNQ